jgi:hypothetical protein
MVHEGVCDVENVEVNIDEKKGRKFPEQTREAAGFPFPHLS